ELEVRRRLDPLQLFDEAAQGRALPLKAPAPRARVDVRPRLKAQAADAGQLLYLFTVSFAVRHKALPHRYACNLSRRNERARLIRDFTVPSFIRRMIAISS